MHSNRKRLDCFTIFLLCHHIERIRCKKKKSTSTYAHIRDKRTQTHAHTFIASWSETCNTQSHGERAFRTRHKRPPFRTVSKMYLHSNCVCNLTRHYSTYSMRLSEDMEQGGWPHVGFLLFRMSSIEFWWLCWNLSSIRKSKWIALCGRNYIWTLRIIFEYTWEFR